MTQTDTVNTNDQALNESDPLTGELQELERLFLQLDSAGRKQAMDQLRAISDALAES